MKYTKLTIFYLPQTDQVENSYLYDNQLLHLQTVIHLLLVKPFHIRYGYTHKPPRKNSVKGLHQQRRFSECWSGLLYALLPRV